MFMWQNLLNQKDLNPNPTPTLKIKRPYHDSNPKPNLKPNPNLNPKMNEKFMIN